LISNYIALTHIYSLKPLDIEIMKRLGSRVNLIPVIAKADTLTPKDLETFKKRVSHLWIEFFICDFKFTKFEIIG